MQASWQMEAIYLSTGQDRRGVVSIKEDAQYWGFGLALSYVLRVMCADERLKRPSGALFFND